MGDLDGERLGRLLADAEQCAVLAGQVLREHQGRLAGIRTEFKGRRELVTVADRESERAVVGGLLERYPDHAMLAEEGVLTERGAVTGTSDFTWIVDPLDGTTNFVHGLPFFSVAVALVYRDEPVLGVVHAPMLAWTFTAARGLGARKNGEPIAVSGTDDVGHALLGTGFSYSRNEPGRDDNSGRVASVLPHCRDLRRMGSAEIDLALVASGQFDGFWELYLEPYDVAAGAVIVREAGGTVTDLRGGDDWLHGGQILASNGPLHEPLLAMLQ